MQQSPKPQRDLNWCLASPSLLVDNEWSGFEPFSIDALPVPPDPHRFRLGRHFEQTLQAWMRAADDIELLESNLQVRDGKTTVGEFDFIVRYRGEVEHWEAAIKFYLGVGHRKAESDFFGPNTADRLDIKLARLRDHQLKLASHPAAKPLLEEKGLEVVRSRCLIKGRLFHPWGESEVSPPGINPEHETGWWMRDVDFREQFGGSDARFAYLPKSLWLAPLVSEDIGTPLSFTEIDEILTAPRAEQATHIAIVDERGELSRGFVVNQQWLTRVNAA